MRRPFAWKPVIREIIRGVVLMLLFLVFQEWFEETVPGQVVQQGLYDLVQLTFNTSDVVNNIAVVDLAGLPHEYGVTPELSYTDRRQLYNTLDAVVKQSPCRVGIDLDFDFMLDPYLKRRQDDFQFLSRVDKLNRESKFSCGPRLAYTQTHIFLGAYKSTTLGDRVFGNPAWKQFAAFVGSPQLEAWRVRGSMTQRLTLLRPGVPAGSADQKNSVEFLSLASAVAGTQIENAAPSWATDQNMEMKGNAFSAQHVFVDYSPLEKLKVIPLNQLDQSNLKEKYVLLGRGGDADSTDHFNAPGHRNGSIPGVLLQACATYTLLTKGLIALTEPASRVIDAGLTSFVIVVVALLNGWLRARNKEPGERIELWAQVGATVFLLLVAVLLGQLASHVLWDDFFMMIVAVWVGWGIGYLTSTGHAHSEGLTEIDETISEHLSVDIKLRQTRSRGAGA